MRLSDAISFVRARLDEIAFNQDDMITDVEQDDRNLDTTIERLLPEAARMVILAAPSHLLEPEEVLRKENVSGPVHMVVAEDFLRLVYVKASDSEVYVSSAVPFNTPEARMQANEYLRGTPDAPVVVQRPYKSYQVHFTYYSVLTEGSVELAYIKKSALEDGEIFCPENLEEAVYNQLTSMVLETYGDQRFQLFQQKANSYLAK